MQVILAFILLLPLFNFTLRISNYLFEIEFAVQKVEKIINLN